MKQKSIYIHIGLEKTGTTSIQNFFYHNKKELQQKSIFYPTQLGKNHAQLAICTGKSEFVKSLTSCKNEEVHIKKEFPNTLKDIMKQFEKSNCNILLFSNEYLSSRLKNIEDITNLKRLFQNYPYPVKIIVYIRNQVDLLESLYFETIKTGTTETLPEWVRTFNYFELDYMKLLEEWEAVFGKSSIIVKLFNKKVLKNRNVIDDFLNIFEIENSNFFIKTGNENISLGYKSIEFMRQYNFYVEKKERNIYGLISALAYYPNDKEKVSLSSSDRISIFNKYKESNDIFVQKYLPNISYDVFTTILRESKEQKNTEKMLWDIINYLIKQNVQMEKEVSINIKGKIWRMGSILTKKLKIYWLLQPLVRQLKKIKGRRS